MSEFVNIPRVVNRARENELRRFGIQPLNYSKWNTAEPPRATRKLTPNQIRRFEKNLALSLESNNSNNINKNRRVSNASDPKVYSRSSSPGFKGGKRTRKHSRRHRRSHTRKH